VAAVEITTCTPLFVLRMMCVLFLPGAALAVYLDVSQRGGKLLTAVECAQRYPHMKSVLMPQEEASTATHDPHIMTAGVSPLLSVWSNLARTMVLAHQRRGESDLVAHWLYQLLALDTTAEEWAHALQH